jgi:hypothetical protein
MLSRNNANPGDLKTRKITAGGKDISNHVLSVVIVENMFEFTWSATLFVNDMNNLLINADLAPGQDVSIEIATKHGNKNTDGEKEFNFKISRISGRQFQNENLQSYMIDCVDSSFLTNSTTRVIETFENKTEIIIAKSMAEKVGCSFKDFEDSKAKITHQFLGVTPFAGVAQMIKSAGGGDYVFFQCDSDSSFIIKPLSLLYEEDSGVELFMRPHGITLEERHRSDNMLTFSKYAIRDTNVLLDNGLGMNGTTLNQFDFVNKMNKRTEQGNNPQANTGFVPFHEGATDKATTQNQSAANWFFSRKAFLSKIENNVLTVQIPGGAAEWEWIGKTIEVKLPSQQSMKKNMLFDPDFEGKYLVSGVTHNIGLHDYLVNLELLKYELGA